MKKGHPSTSKKINCTVSSDYESVEVQQLQNRIALMCIGTTRGSACGGGRYMGYLYLCSIFF